MRRHAKALVASVAMFVLLGAPGALASLTHKEGASLDGSATPNHEANGGGFGTLGGLAIGSGGDLYAVDTGGSASAGIEGTGAVHRFDSSGAYGTTVDGAATPAGSLALSTDSHLALDSSGNLFLDDTNHNLVVAMEPGGAPLTSFSTDGQLDGTETPATSFSYVCGIALDPINGDVLVSDAFNNRVWIFDSAGTYQGRIADSSQLNGPCGLAFDSSGDLYVRNWFPGNVVKFHRAAARTFDFERLAYDPTNGTAEDFDDDLPAAIDVAVDQSSNDLYVDAGSRISQYEQSGGLVSTFAQNLSGSTGIAVDGAGEKLYATDASASPPLIRTYSTAITVLPEATTGDFEEVTGISAVVQGTVDAAGGPQAECEFEYGTTTAYGQSASCQPAGPYPGSEAVHAELTGLTPATTYHFRLHATSSETGPGAEANGADATFTTTGPPLIESFSLAEVGTSSATFKGHINPSGEPTSYRFEYVDDAGFDAGGFATATRVPVPDEGIGAGSTGVSVSQAVTGLSPATGYHVRLLATSVAGSAESVVKRFKTAAPPAPREPGSFPGQGFLPDHRAWEMVSPPDKNGGDVVVETSRIRPAAGESPGLPMAITFPSLSGFAGAVGTGIGVDYLAQRTAEPGTNGWSTHAITPPQESLPFLAAFQSLDPFYVGDLSSDLTSGVFRAWSPLTSDPGVADVVNLYARHDLRSGGAGSYELATPCPRCEATSTPLAPIVGGTEAPFLAGASEDFRSVVFESRLSLTSDAGASTGRSGNIRLYKYSHGAVHLLAPSPACAGATPASPAGVSACSAAGASITLLKPKPSDAVSADGSRVFVTSPVNLNPKPGAAPKLYLFDDGDTATSADDAVIQVNASENPAPELAQAANFQTASRDGNRVFFTSDEQLTETPTSGLYMWARQEEDETQQVTVDAESGTFTLTAHTQPSVGSGDLALGSSTVENVTGSFTVGQTIEGAGIQPGSVVTALGTFSNASNSKFTLSKPAVASGGGVELKASMQATTAPLPSDAAAAEVQAALEELESGGRRLYGEGNVRVAGGPGGPGAASPYLVTFTGALHGVDVMPMTADGSALVGGASTAAVTVTNAVHNLSLIGEGASGVHGRSVIGGTSNDGHRVYFVAPTQLVPGGPAVTGDGLFYWQDAEGPPGGSLAFVGEFSGRSGPDSNMSGTGGVSWNLLRSTSRVTPDGRYLLFVASDGSGFLPEYDNGTCNQNGLNDSSGKCAEFYVYRAATSTALSPDVLCASCNPTGAPATASARLDSRDESAGGMNSTWHLTHAISDDGRYVFFSSAERLVPEDVNGTEDAYEYDTATERVHLLSSGESQQRSFFVGADNAGHNAFFVTNEPLSGWDVDGSRDLYDARVEGGVAEPLPPPPACQGDACQPAPTELNDATPSSASYSGRGNARPRRAHCRRGARRVRRHGKVRCEKRRHKRRHRGAAATGRASR